LRSLIARAAAPDGDGYDRQGSDGPKEEWSRFTLSDGRFTVVSGV
jgi:hypothetical protein